MRQRIGRVFLQHGAGALEDDGAVVVFLINEMDGAAGNFAAVGENSLVDASAVHPGAAECGEEGGVNVHDAILIARGNVEHAKPAREADEVDVVLVEEFENGFGKIGGAELRIRANRETFCWSVVDLYDDWFNAIRRAVEGETERIPGL